MAVLEMPEAGVGQSRFEPERVDYQSPTTGGRTGNVAAGFPRWEAEYALTGMEDHISDEWQAFVRRLRGGQRYFFGSDLRRPYPKAYPTGFAGLVRASGGAFNGNATGWAVDGTRTMLALAGLPAGFDLGLIDYGDFRWGPGNEKRALISFVTAGLADAEGEITLEVDPPVPTLVPPTATFSFDKPACLMRVTTESRLDGYGLEQTITGSIKARSELVP